MFPLAFAQAPVKTASVFYFPEVIARATANAGTHDWARTIRDDTVRKAEPWLALSDDALWDLMVGPNIPRTWHVWSDGYCPSCKQDVRMYDWIADPWKHPWKLQCPKCAELFPKNDFERFHRSGFNEHGVFQPHRADRSLLFNADHPDPADSLHTFGVDDGHGYVADGHRWRFIGYYIIFGQWKKWVHEGIVSLSAAYAVTGEPKYAYKAAVLLDRVADLYPSFDFHTQGGWVYETTNGTRGQVSTWHDACEEVRAMAYAYDRVFDGAKAQEEALVSFLSRKAAECRLANTKSSWADIQRNIESGIFEDTLAHRERIESNYPRTDMTNLVIDAVLRWPTNREAVLQQLDAIIEKSTAVDGMSGEKGLAGYSSIAPSALAEIMIQMMRLEPGFLKTVYERRPAIYDAFRFNIDTWCMEEWYPRTGDTGAFGQKNVRYAGLSFTPNSAADGSEYSFFWDLYEVTKDPALVQVMYLSNGSKLDGLPHDLFGEDPEVFQADVKSVIDREGTELRLSSANKQKWCLAVMRSGKGADRRALWIDYDSGGGHGHFDGMNIGYFAKGLDLVPDFGYPPVGYGGWGAPRATWYRNTASHATVVVDGKNQSTAQGTTTLWADGDGFHAIRAASPDMIGGEIYERTIAMIDIDTHDSYVVDCFRVKGGRDHAKFFGSSFGTIVTGGLTLTDAPDYGGDTQMRAFKADAAPKPGWHVDWTIDDKRDYVPDDRTIRLRYTDLTEHAEASVCEAWVDTGIYGEASEWVPRVMVRRKTESAPLESTFVSVIEPYEGKSKIAAIRRWTSSVPDSTPCIEIERSDGTTDVVLFNATGSTAPAAGGGVQVHGDLACVSRTNEGVHRIRVANATEVLAGPVRVIFKERIPYFDLMLAAGEWKPTAGSFERIEQIFVDGEPLIK
ncbi:MAG: heparinase II/III family protein [Candidatus Hydrogenedentes bacterium]|nr:heparinase II/III family protein [Candidatus Hydrogenedentota bacterium]